MVENVSVLSELIRGGPNQYAMTTQIALIQERLGRLENESEANKHDARASLSSAVELEKVDRHGKWQVRTALIVSGLGLLGSIATLVLHLIR